MVKFQYFPVSRLVQLKGLALVFPKKWIITDTTGVHFHIPQVWYYFYFCPAYWVGILLGVCDI